MYTVVRCVFYSRVLSFRRLPERFLLALPAAETLVRFRSSVIIFPRVLFESAQLRRNITKHYMTLYEMQL